MTSRCLVSYPLVILDRDGVINHDSPGYIRCPEDWQPIAGSCEAIAQLHQSGHKVAVATNQSGIGRGLYSEQTYRLIEEKMMSTVAGAGGIIDCIRYCPHTPEDHCQCRKPKPGMLIDICHYFGYSPEDAVMVGDSVRDIEAARAAGCAAVLVLTGNGCSTKDNYSLGDTEIYADLASFAAHKELLDS